MFHRELVLFQSDLLPLLLHVKTRKEEEEKLPDYKYAPRANVNCCLTVGKKSRAWQRTELMKKKRVERVLLNALKRLIHKLSNNEVFATLRRGQFLPLFSLGDDTPNFVWGPLFAPLVPRIFQISPPTKKRFLSPGAGGKKIIIFEEVGGDNKKGKREETFFCGCW